ncbi:HD-GYP domain-containing protein [Paramaledivibacter caminithermalis]|jgi:HD-GYP domain-containing protein (c-di-GMP phosphodiesterase class II)|uniref:HD-GYP domain, c-di-GMP phosphodiesterase class II (Or its inactivated variant) n=1 Tax=Paramaledivibacter caminithermalis (strain DSM 15212 / CIP 107654 / DViRD3) TaxID=1121301 RepID=A0A1M6TB54_PARC5|nr:HD-GYP domain-containing protein [Paramaledivibacter caminithermalis]SHK53988.1 HD-GYP domain, c-di-GMP phosphodiesterase class II (or its inactivated variant) [Paramaledivibacter caminithermalis DSM 15212]
MGRKMIKTNVNELKEGMILGENLYDSFGNILLGEGIVLKESYIVKIKRLNIADVYIKEKTQKIHNYGEKENIKDPYLKETRLQAKKIVKEAMGKLHFNEVLLDKTIAIVSKMIDELISNDEIIISLRKLRSIDDYTLEHSVNVCILSLIIGIAMKIEYSELMELGVGAMLHDIGKRFIPKEILNKPSPLTLKEYEIVKNHTTYGYNILKKSKKISEIAAEIALCHHERLDGNGYPNKRMASEINTYSKIVALCDVYDALTSDRVYKKKIEPHKALEYICKMVNIQFDAQIVKKLIDCIGIYPIGSLVKLSTNEIGLVVDINKINPTKPVIKILLDEKGRKIHNYFEVDISKNPTIKINDVIPKFEGDFKFTNF